MLPQTPTPRWRAAIEEALTADENVDEVYESLVHTLGNLTLTGYNAELSNADFAIKRPQLAGSGLAMNKEIASQERWGRPEIHNGARVLADRAIAIWPGPARRESTSVTAERWELLDKALAALPTSSWTTYGDVAALIGSHPVPVGERLANHPTVNAHRVLRVDGTLSPGFRWTDPAITAKPFDVLDAEGVEFDENGRANPNQRITSEELAQLLATADSLDAGGKSGELAGGDREKQFFTQLAESQPAAVVDGLQRVLDRWTEVGGTLEFGFGAETSCFLMATVEGQANTTIWPLTLYPSGRCEVVFQHLARRPPFDDIRLREELRQRLNTVAGIDLAAAKIELRPSFPLSVLSVPATASGLAESLEWFHAALEGTHATAAVVVG